MRYIFDLETNGLLDEVTKIHCIVAANLTTRKLQKFSTEAGNIEEGLKLLADAEELIGHNIMGYDLMVIKKLYPTWHTTAKLTDTLIQCRLIRCHCGLGNILERDAPILRPRRASQCKTTRQDHLSKLQRRRYGFGA